MDCLKYANNIVLIYNEFMKKNPVLTKRFSFHEHFHEYCDGYHEERTVFDCKKYGYNEWISEEKIKFDSECYMHFSIDHEMSRWYLPYIDRGLTNYDFVDYQNEDLFEITEENIFQMSTIHDECTLLFLVIISTLTKHNIKAFTLDTHYYDELCTLLNLEM